jgi:signal transduction histidine kinase
MSEMNWHYQYTPYIWPSLVCGVFLAVLSVYAWRRRSVPGALPFAVMCFFSLPWAAGSALVHAAAEAPAKIFWLQFETVCYVPIATASLCFALDYADLGRWLNRRTLSLFAVPPVLILILALTNRAHHLVWLGFSTQGHIIPQHGTVGWVSYVYCMFLLMATSVVFLWLFVRSPLHRWPVALCLCGQLAVRVSVPLAYSDFNPIAPLDPMVIAGIFAATTYALALFRFRMFKLIPIARGTAIEQMSEGMLVLDGQQRIIDLNPAAEKILGVAATRARGAILAEAFPECVPAATEIIRGRGDTTQYYALHHSTLKDKRGLPLGSLILFRDVTEQRRAQAQTLEQQCALATLRERDRVARELHDSLGQVLGYVKMQTQAARTLLARDRASEADACLAQLSAVAQDAHADVRDYILSVRAAGPENPGFLATLEAYLQRFTQHYGIVTKLNVEPALADRPVEPMVEAQLLRIIQEALSNVRKHAGACGVHVRLGASDGWAETIVQDDGAGFDPALLDTAAGREFGLSFMRERAEEVGGNVRVHSSPGKGTQVVIRVPLRKECS